MGQIGSMWYNIGAKTAELEKGLANSKSKVSGLKGSFTELNSGLEIARKGFQVLSDVYKVTILEAAEAEKMSAKLNSVLASTGYEAGVSRYELDQYASSLSKVTVNSEETIMNAEALLLTFTKVGKEVFPEALKAAMDMSAAFGQDLNSSIIQVGKALNDPAGMSAMKRIGVSFSDAQIAMAKSMFETGDVAGYQKLIMGELNKEVGGMALAMGTTYAGQVEILKNNLSELGEAIGSKNIGDFTAFVVMLNNIAAGTKSTSGAMADYLNVIFDGTIMESKKHRANEQELIDLQKLEFANGTAEVTGKKLVDGYYLWRDASGSWHRELQKGIGTLDDYEKAAEEAADSAKKLSNSFGKLTNEMIYNELAASLDAEGQLDLARRLGLVDENAYNALNQMQGLTEKFDLNGDGLITLTERTEEYYKALKKVTDTAGTYHWKFVVTTNSIVAPQVQSPSSYTYKQPTPKPIPPGQTNYNGHGANGMDMIVPAGFYSDNYTIGVKTGEHVKITPTGASESSSFERQLLNALGSFDPYMNALILSNQLIKSGR
jgi:hypothetical protein